MCVSSSAVCLVTTYLYVVLLTRNLFYVIGPNVPVKEVHTASAHSGEVRVAAGRPVDERATISTSTLEEFAREMRYNECICLRVCVRKRVCMVCVLFVWFSVISCDHVVVCDSDNNAVLCKKLDLLNMRFLKRKLSPFFTREKKAGRGMCTPYLVFVCFCLVFC